MGFWPFWIRRRKHAKAAVQALKEYGVTVKVLDREIMRKSPAPSAGRWDLNVNRILLGRGDWTLFPTKNWEQLAENITVFAKLSPIAESPRLSECCVRGATALAIWETVSTTLRL